VLVFHSEILLAIRLRALCSCI